MEQPLSNTSSTLNG